MEERVADERISYLGSAVLGLNDALVELSGGLTGLVSSISDTKLIGFTGIVIGLAASLSMAASNFLSVSAGGEGGIRPGKAAAYTGTAYIAVVIALVAPFFLVDDRVIALGMTWTIAAAVIVSFSYYSSVLQGRSFPRLFAQMLALGLGVGVVTFVAGRILSGLTGIEA
jgi:VIT1/CCC1 family predicted Fe2+/Mn2+ transporter